MIEELGRIGEEVLSVGGEDGDETSFGTGRADNGGFSGDSDVSGGVNEGDAEASHLVDEAKREGLLASPDLPGGKGADFIVCAVAAGRDVMDELGVHIVDERLEVDLFFGCHLAARVSCILEFSGMNDDVLEFGPAHKVAVVGPLHDDADGAYDRGVVGIDFVAGTGDVIGA